MYQAVAPTKSSLLRAKAILAFSVKGFELLDKKRNVLIQELMSLTGRAKSIQGRISVLVTDAYQALQFAEVTLGSSAVSEIAVSVPEEKVYKILLRSVMGVEIPTVSYEKEELEAYFGFFRTNPALDLAVARYRELKYLIYELAEIDTSIYKLVFEIKKTQKRANALDKIQIPKYREIVKFISDVLEEKEREDFFRLKKVKAKKRMQA